MSLKVQGSDMPYYIPYPIKCPCSEETIVRFTRIALQFGLVLVIVGSLFFVRWPVGHVVEKMLVAGWPGILLWLAVIATVAILPVPSEPFMSVTLKHYGLFYGTLFNFVGVLVGALLLFGVGRLMAPIVHTFLARTQTHALSRRVAGLIRNNQFRTIVFVQLLPFPFLLVNLVLGAFKSVPMWTFVGASLIGFAPYQLGWTALYAGTLHVHHLWIVSLLAVGALVLISLIHRLIKIIAS